MGAVNGLLLLGFCRSAVGLPSVSVDVVGCDSETASSSAFSSAFVFASVLVLVSASEAGEEGGSSASLCSSSALLVPSFLNDVEGCGWICGEVCACVCVCEHFCFWS